MGDRIQARGYFLECLLFTERGEHGKQRTVKGVKGWLALQNTGTRKRWSMNSFDGVFSS